MSTQCTYPPQHNRSVRCTIFRSKSAAFLSNNRPSPLFEGQGERCKIITIPPYLIGLRFWAKGPIKVGDMENNVKEKKIGAASRRIREIFSTFPEIFFGLLDKIALFKWRSHVALLNRGGDSNMFFVS